MRFPAPASIRLSLILLVLAAVLPALAILLFSGFTLRQSMVQSAESAALRQIQTMATHHERVVDNARLLLATLARAREVQMLDAPACQQLLDEMRQANKAYAHLALADTGGLIVALSGPGSFAGIKDEHYFQQAVQKRHFVMGGYHLVAGTKHVVMEFAQPILSQEGRLLGVLVASFDLRYFGQIFADAHLPAGSVFTLTDAAGMRLTRFPETEKYTWVPDLPQMIARMSGPSGEGTFLEQGVDGVRRLYSFKRLQFEDTPLQHLMIRLGQPEDLALAEARRAELRNTALMILAAILAVIAAWLVGKFAILSPMQGLMNAADRLGTGDLVTRTGLVHSKGELGRLAAAFDRMAAGLQLQDRDRRLAEEEVASLNKDLENRVMQRTAELAQANAELHDALEDLHKAQGQLVMSEKLAALGGLVSGVAHEINTPVGNSITAASFLAGRTQELLHKLKENQMKRSELEEFLDTSAKSGEIIVGNLNRASELIRTFKQTAVDQQVEEKRLVNMLTYLHEVLLSLRPRLKKTKHTIEIDCPDDLNATIYPGALWQILTNFIMNTLVHAYEPDEAGLIQIAVSLQDHQLTLRYRDNGRGMPEEVQKKVFEPFFTTKRGSGGTGLGLHIVYNLVVFKLKGTILCHSTPGEGTEFIITAPLTPEGGI